MYDSFSQDYDRFVYWPGRLALELPFLEAQASSVPAPDGTAARILDAACGTGMHTIALGQRGYPAAGADLSLGMIARARQNATATGVQARFEVAAFGQLEMTFGSAAFDLLLCLGNSLPHLLSPDDLAKALTDFRAVLRPGGRLVIQNRNFDAILAQRERWMEPQSHQDGPEEWVFLRFYDYLPDGLIGFNILTLHRQADTAWTQSVTTTFLRPLLKDELVEALSGAGLEPVNVYGSLAAVPFNLVESGNLVLVAQKSQ